MHAEQFNWQPYSAFVFINVAYVCYHSSAIVAKPCPEAQRMGTVLSQAHVRSEQPQMPEIAHVW